ncbi:MAG: hypothetical protein ACYCY5_08220 [Sulfuricella sp.]
MMTNWPKGMCMRRGNSGKSRAANRLPAQVHQSKNEQTAVEHEIFIGQAQAARSAIYAPASKKDMA